jgi:hypothetical protein
MATRIEREEQLIGQYFPGFRIQSPDDPAYAGVIGRLLSSRNIQYTLWIPLGNFPNEAPKMYIVEPKSLKDSNGRLLSDYSANGSMHLLSPDNNRHPQICHYNGRYWSPNVTLYKIIMKGRLWIEAYENHLITGNNIDHYLKHM